MLSALALEARGRRFKSFYSDHISSGLKVLRGRTPALQAGRWSSSLHQSIKNFMSVVGLDWSKTLRCHRGDIGSNPIRRSKHFPCGCSSNGTKSAALPMLRLRVQVPSSTPNLPRGRVTQSSQSACLTNRKSKVQIFPRPFIESLWRSLTGRAPDC